MVVHSSLPDVEVPNITYDQYLFHFLEQHGNKLALISADDNENALTFLQVKENAIKYASTLLHLGVRKGDVVAVCISNCVEYACFLLGAIRIGAIFTTCNSNYTEDEIFQRLNNSQPRIVIAEAANHQVVKNVAKNVSKIKHIFTVNRCSGCECFQDIMKNTETKDAIMQTQTNHPDDICLLLHSSGTTGLPKGVMHSHRSLIAIAQLARSTFTLTALDTFYMVSPFFHVIGTVLLSISLAQGTSFVLRKRYSIRNFFKDVEKFKITTVFTVPPIVIDVYNSSFHSKHDISSLNSLHCGGSPLPQGVAVFVKEKLGISLFQSWGATEFLPITCGRANVMVPTNSVGFVVPNTLLKVVDSITEAELGPNKSGELLVKGPQLMKGYYKNPTATANCIDETGWFHTGDIGYYDEHGLIYIVGRIKELIKYKGFQVAPAEIEEMLLRHPSISDAGVVGIPDPIAGEVPKAYIVTKNKISPKEIHEFLKGKLSSYKYLRGGIVFCDSIPKNASGKILRRELQEMGKKSKL